MFDVINVKRKSQLYKCLHPVHTDATGLFLGDMEKVLCAVWMSLYRKSSSANVNTAALQKSKPRMLFLESTH